MKYDEMPRWIARSTNLDHEMVVEKILRHLHKVIRPVFLGEFSIEAGISLQKAEHYAVYLQETGQIRAATGSELLRIGAEPGSHVYVLIAPRDLKIAHGV